VREREREREKDEREKDEREMREMREYEISADPIVKAFDFLEMEERVRGREDRR